MDEIRGKDLTRRVWLSTCAGALAFGQGPAFVRSDRPEPQAVMAGDVIPGSAIIWSRANQPARMVVSWQTSEHGPAQTLTGPHCIDATDYTGRVELTALPPGQTILYEVRFQSLRNDRALSEPLKGSFRTPPAGPRNIRFLWTGDQVGQGWGINPELGGLRIYDVMARREPDFFVHSGDTIYADNPLLPEVALPDGTVWRNIVTEAKSKVAETLDEYRGQYRYNLLDEHLRRFCSTVGQVWQWDDHEVMNNWSPGKSVQDDARYKEKDVPLWWRGPRAHSLSMRRCVLRRAKRSASTVEFPMARCSTCSCWTCAAIADPTVGTGRSSRDRTPTIWRVPNWNGSNAGCANRRRFGRPSQ